MMTGDLFLDVATLSVRTQSGANALGEPVFTDTDTPIAGMLVVKARQTWAEWGLAQGTEAVFVCAKDLDVPAGASLTVGGITYRQITVSRRNDLFGDEPVTRLLLAEGPK